MKRAATVTTLLAMALGGAAVQAADQDVKELKGAEASIPFANMRSSIRDWEADGREGLWVQDAHRQWYYAKLISPCQGLDFALRVGFDIRGTDKLDRFATVVVPDHERCAIQSFTKSDGPADSRDNNAPTSGD